MADTPRFCCPICESGYAIRSSLRRHQQESHLLLNQPTAQADYAPLSSSSSFPSLNAIHDFENALRKDLSDLSFGQLVSDPLTAGDAVVDEMISLLVETASVYAEILEMAMQHAPL